MVRQSFGYAPTEIGKRTNSIKQMTRLGFRCCSTVFTPRGLDISGATSKPLVISIRTRGPFTHQYVSVESLQLLAQRKRCCVLNLVALGGRLDHTLASITRRGDTGERIGFLVLKVLVSQVTGCDVDKMEHTLR